jgi:hypothetical protein
MCVLPARPTGRTGRPDAPGAPPDAPGAPPDAPGARRPHRAHRGPGAGPGNARPDLGAFTPAAEQDVAEGSTSDIHPKGQETTMQHMTARELDASQRLHERLSDSRVGLRWERIFRRHQQEIESIIAVRAEVRENLWAALCRLDDATRAGRLDDSLAEAATRALDDLERHGGIALRRDAQRLRDELSLARGRSLEQILRG